MFESIASFDQNLHDISYTHALEKKILLSLQHFLSPCLTVFAVRTVYTGPLNYAHHGSKQRQYFRPQNA